jgi:hypothetical protein
MTGRRLALVAADTAPVEAALVGAGPVEHVRALLRPELLAEVWDADGEVFAPPRAHPLLGLRKCAVVDCEAGVRTPNTDLCKLCVEKFKVSGLPMRRFTQIPANKIGKGERWCRVPGCQRPSHLRALLCSVHSTQWRQTSLTAEQFAVSLNVKPLPSFGSCAVVSCSRAAAGVDELCGPHRQRWYAAREEFRGDISRWLRIAEPINVDHLVVFKGLAERVQLELLLGLQLRTDAGIRTLLTALRPIVAVLRRTEAAQLADLDESLIKQTRHDAAVLARYLMTAVRRATTSPEEERRNDVWDLQVFGLRGRLRFTSIRQTWLRESAKLWAEEELPRHRGRQAAKTVKTTVAAVSELSASLHLSRTDHGDLPRELSRRDIVALTNRFAHRQRTGEISEKIRLTSCRALRRFLLDIRAMGLSRPDGMAAGLPDDVIMNRQDIPPEPGPDEAGRDLPAWVMRILNDNLPTLEQRSGIDVRRMTELMIDTGRRPDEICQLRLDCLTRDGQGKSVLITPTRRTTSPADGCPSPRPQRRSSPTSKPRSGSDSPVRPSVSCPCSPATRPTHAAPRPTTRLYSPTPTGSGSTP